MLMVHIINIIVVRITSYKKISSRTAADHQNNSDTN